MSEKCTLGILLGDAAGIGPELVAKVCKSGYLTEKCRPVIIGDKRVFDHICGVVGAEVDCRVIYDAKDISFDEKSICFYDQQNIGMEDFSFGTVCTACGKASVEQINLAVELWKGGFIDGCCFAPFNKAAMIAHIGSAISSERAIMAKALDYHGPLGEINHCGTVWTTRVASHVPVCRICEVITKESVSAATELLYGTLIRAGFKAPRIAMAALNPHAGENGRCGTEEITILTPVIEDFARRGIQIDGPFPADTVFVRAIKQQKYDGIVTMYHDQGQIALKLIGFEQGVTIEGGMPMPFTTAAHGTAYGKAGKGTASVTAFENAISDAVSLSSQKV